MTRDTKLHLKRCGIRRYIRNLQLLLYHLFYYFLCFKYKHSLKLDGFRIDYHFRFTNLNWLNSKKIEFVPKYLNPANAPKTRPIEDFWGILKGKVYAKNWSAKSIPELKRKIRICLKEMDVNLVQSIAGSVQKRLDTVQRKGYDAL